MPVQRVPRYRMLVADLLKHTSQLHSDYIILQQCLKSIEETAMAVNQMIPSQVPKSDMSIPVDHDEEELDLLKKRFKEAPSWIRNETKILSRFLFATGSFQRHML